MEQTSFSQGDVVNKLPDFTDAASKEEKAKPALMGATSTPPKSLGGFTSAVTKDVHSRKSGVTSSSNIYNSIGSPTALSNTKDLTQPFSKTEVGSGPAFSSQVTEQPTNRSSDSQKRGNVNHIVPGVGNKKDVNIVDYSGQIAHDPSVAFSNEMLLSKSGALNYNDPKNYQQGTVGGDYANLDPNEKSYDAREYKARKVENTSNVKEQNRKDGNTYDATETFDRVKNQDMTGAQGQLSDGSIIQDEDIPQIDTEAVAAGQTGTGQALKDYAKLSRNEIWKESTVKGQIDDLQAEFTDADGNPKIPAWASGIARQISKTAAFSGLSGTAATAAMSQALLESSIQIAEKDAKFFQGVQMQNLDNEQQSLIQRASVLANMDMANLDARGAAAAQNAKAFLQMDMANLDNDQQARVLNQQMRVEALFNDQSEKNAQKRFNAESKNDMEKYYSQLSQSARIFNSEQNNTMKRFNADAENTERQTNAAAVNRQKEFNKTLASQREIWEREMKHEIDVSNAQWRQELIMSEGDARFEAAAFDAKNMVAFSQEAMNKLWDRSDALLDYAWKSAENEADRDTNILLQQMQSLSQKEMLELQDQMQDDNALGQLFGDVFSDLIGGIFS